MTTSDSLCTDLPPSQKKKSGEESRLPSRGDVCTQATDKWLLFCDLLSLFVILLCLAFQIYTRIFVPKLNTLVRVFKNLLKTNFYEASIFTKGIKLLQVVYIFLSLYEQLTNWNFWRLGIDLAFHFFFSEQVLAVSIDMIHRHFFSRWLTNQDGHLWNCLRIDITVMPYTIARLMDLLLVEAMTYILSTTRHPVAIPTLILAILTAHQAGTAIKTSLPTHSYKDKVIHGVSHQTR